jgi:hypothetical protein
MGLRLTFTRDSALLWLAFAGVVLGYFATQGNPAHWDFDKWIAFGLMLVGWITGKLQNSPLESHREQKTRQALEGDA